MTSSPPPMPQIPLSYRKEWNDDPCRLKLSFELWTLMKAEGLAQNSDAQFFRENCVHTMEVGRIELVTPEVWQCPNNH